VNLTSNTCTKEVTNPGDIVDWFADTKFQVRGALATTIDGGFQLKVRDNVASAWRPLTTWKTQDAMNSHAIGFAPGDKSIYAVSSIGANTSRFVEIPLATGTAKVLASNRKVDVNKIMIHPKRHQVQAVSFLKDRSDAWEILDSDVKKDFKTIKKLQEGSFEIVSRDLADKTWLVKFDSDRSPGKYFTYNRQTREGKTLFTTRPKLRNYTLAKMKPVTITSRDGMDLHSFLTLPVGVEAKKLPAVILVRHGAWAQDTWGFDPTVQWLANRGYVVLQVNFRGSTGFGKNFTNAGDREWGGKMHDDLIDGVNWLTDKGYADKNKIAIFGGGIYGGYAALVGLSFTPNVFACGVDMVGISNLVTWMKNFPPYWEPYRALVAKRIGDPNDTTFLTARSPFFKADRITKPLIIAQGAKDPYIKRTESDQIVAALKTTGVPVEYKIFEDEGHLLRKPENRLAFYAATETFLAKHIGGRQQR
jgi:dipeptidyl aminopeptidase/acylaminoacyl peptidase